MSCKGYDYAIQCGLQRLTVCWTAPEKEMNDVN